jgi:hypothetical protein
MMTYLKKIFSEKTGECLHIIKTWKDNILQIMTPLLKSQKSKQNDK